MPQNIISYYVIICVSVQFRRIPTWTSLQNTRDHSFRENIEMHNTNAQSVLYNHFHTILYTCRSMWPMSRSGGFRSRPIFENKCCCNNAMYMPRTDNWLSNIKYNNIDKCTTCIICYLVSDINPILSSTRSNRRNGRVFDVKTSAVALQTSYAVKPHLTNNNNNCNVPTR